MHASIVISFTTAVVALALPSDFRIQGRGNNVLGWCDSTVPRCAYTSLWDCTGPGGNSYRYCVEKCACVNKKAPSKPITIPKHPKPNPNTVPHPDELPLESFLPQSTAEDPEYSESIDDGSQNVAQVPASTEYAPSDNSAVSQPGADLANTLNTDADFSFSKG